MLEDRRRGDEDSDDGDEEEAQEPEYYPEQSSDSESDSDDPADRKAPELPQLALTTTGTQEIAKDGTVWSHVTPGSRPDGPPGRHLFTDKPGPTLRRGFMTIRAVCCVCWTWTCCSISETVRSRWPAVRGMRIGICL